MAKSTFERALEKQQQEQKRIADNQRRMSEKQAREEKERARNASIDAQAQSIVGNATNYNGLRIMDRESELFLEEALKKVDSEDPYGEITIRINDLPENLQRSFSLQIKKLEHYGIISGAVNYTYFVRFTLTPEGLSYFTDKEKALSMPEKMKQTQRQKYDVFISHATKDKEDYVDELFVVLRKLGINIFYDTESISWGDNLKQTILNGTAESEFAIIVISQNFFSREWTELELNEFLNQQNENGQKKILPLLHNITIDELKAHYPELGEVLAINSKDYSKQDVAILLAKELIKRYR